MRSTRQIIFVVPPFVHVLDLTGPVQVFYEASEYGASYKLTYCSYQSELVSSAGLGFTKVLPFGDVQPQPGDYVILPGVDMDYLRSAQFRNDGEAFFEWLRQQYRRGVRLCSICTGAFILAQAGLLDGKKCTTHWKRLPELQTSFPKIMALSDKLFVEDAGMYTSAGVTAGIDLALYLVEQEYGPLFATQLALELVVYLRRGDTHVQKSIYLDYRNHINSAIHKVQDWLIENLAKGATLEDLAEIAHMSARNLTRTFRKETDITIQEFTTRLRLELAQSLSNNPGITMEAIAAQCGFQNARQLQRVLHKSRSTPTLIKS